MNGVQVVPSNANISVSWNQVAGGSRYVVSAQGGGDSESCTLNAVSTPVGGFACSIGGLTNGTSYAVSIRVYNAGGTLIAQSSVRTAVPSATPTYPSVPNLAVTPGDARAAVSWSAVQGATGYAVVARYTSDPTSTSRASVTQLHSPALLTGLQNGQTYSVQVTASGAGGMVLARGHILAQPTGTRVSVEGLTVLPRSAALFVSWSAVPSAVRYTGTAQPDMGAAFTCAVSAASVPDLPHCSITGLTNGSTYSVSVSAYDSADAVIGVSAVVSAAPASAPATNLPLITGVSAAPANGTLTVSWTGRVAGATGYAATAALLATPGTAAASASGLNPPLRLSGLTNGSTYIVTVTASDSGGGVLARATAYGQPTSAAAPTILGVRVVPRDGGLFASWPAIENAASYAANVGDPSVATCAVVLAGGPHCVATGLTNGTAYTLIIEARDGSNNLVGRSAIQVTPSATVSNYPLILGTAVAPGDRTLSVVWSTDVAGAVAYRAEARRAGSGTVAATSSDSLNPPLSISGLANGQTYDVTLTAFATDTGGTLSNPIARTVVRAQPAAPDTPLISGIRTVARTGGAVFLSWNELTNAARYTASVESSADTGSCEVVAATTPAGAWCVISGLTAGQTYTLTIHAYDSSGAEIAMNGLTAFTLDPARTPLPPILGVSITPGNQNLSTAWTTEVSGADNYVAAVALAGATVSASGNLSGLNPPLIARELPNDRVYTVTLTAYQGGFAIAQSRAFGRPTAIGPSASPGAPVPTAIPRPAAPAPRLDPNDPIPAAPAGITAATAAVTPVPAELSGTEGATARIERNSLIERAVRLFPMSTQELADSGQILDEDGAVDTAVVSARADAAPHADAVAFPAPLDREAVTVSRVGVLYDGEVETGRRIIFESFRDVNSQSFHILSPVPFDAIRFDFESRAAIPESVDVIWEYSRGYPALDDWFQFVPETKPFRTDAASARAALGLDEDEWRQFQPLHPDGELLSAMDATPDRPRWAVRISLRGELGDVLTESAIADVFIGVDQWGYLPIPHGDSADYHLELSETRKRRIAPSFSAQQMGIRLDDIPLEATIRLNGVRFAERGRDVYTAEMETWDDPDQFAWDNATRSYYDGSLASRPGAWSVDFYERLGAESPEGRAPSRYEFRVGSWTARTNLLTSSNRGNFDYAAPGAGGGDAPVIYQTPNDRRSGRTRCAISVTASGAARSCLSVNDNSANGNAGFGMSQATYQSANPHTSFSIEYNFPAPSWVKGADAERFSIGLNYTCDLGHATENQRITIAARIGDLTSNTVTASSQSTCARNDNITKANLTFSFPAGYRSGLGFSERDVITLDVNLYSDSRPGGDAGNYHAPQLQFLGVLNRLSDSSISPLSVRQVAIFNPSVYAEGDPNKKYDFAFQTARRGVGLVLTATLPGAAAPTITSNNSPFPNSLSADVSRWPPLYLMIHEGGQIIGFDSVSIESGGVTASYAPGADGFVLGDIDFVDSDGNVVYEGVGGPFVSLAHDGELPNWRFADGETVRIVSAADEPPTVAGDAPNLIAPAPDATLNTSEVFGNNFLAQSLQGSGITLRSMWLLILFGGAIGMAVVGYMVTGSALLAATLGMIPIAAGVPMQVIPLWAAIVYGLFAAGGILLKGRIAPGI